MLPITPYGETEKILADLGVIEFHRHSRWRVYPQDVTSTITLTALNVANSFGGWATIIPLNTVPFAFDIIGLVVEQVSAVGVYHIQLGYNIIDADPGLNMEIGERRLRVDVRPISHATELLDLKSQHNLANSIIKGRLKTSTGAADTADISVVLERHLGITREVTEYMDFPW